MFRVKMSLHCSLQLQLFRRLDHVRSNDNSSMFLNPCAVWSCMIWTSNFIIQQFYLLFLQKSKTFLRKYIFKNPENNMKQYEKRRHFEIKGDLENDHNLKGQQYFCIQVMLKKSQCKIWCLSHQVKYFPHYSLHYIVHVINKTCSALFPCNRGVIKIKHTYSARLNLNKKQYVFESLTVKRTFAWNFW